MADEPLIVTVIRRYHPAWVPPRDTGRLWEKTCCPWHGDETASAAVSYELDSYACLGCGVKGNAITLLMREEGVPYRAAKQLAENISPGSHREVPRKLPRVSRRKVFGDERTGVSVNPRADDEVPDRVRRRPSAWS